MDWAFQENANAVRCPHDGLGWTVQENGCQNNTPANAWGHLGQKPQGKPAEGMMGGIPSSFFTSALQQHWGIIAREWEHNGPPIGNGKAS